MYGTVKNWDFVKGMGGISFDDGKGIFAHFSAVEEDDIGRKYLLPGESVYFEMGRHGQHSSPCAVNIRVLSLRDPENLDTYVEEDVIKHLKGTVRVWSADVMRPAGGWVFLHRDHAKGQRMAVGQLWRYHLKPPLAPGLNWCAVDAELIGMEEFSVEELRYSARQVES